MTSRSTSAATGSSSSSNTDSHIITPLVEECLRQPWVGVQVGQDVGCCCEACCVIVLAKVLSCLLKLDALEHLCSAAGLLVLAALFDVRVSTLDAHTARSFTRRLPASLRLHGRRKLRRMSLTATVMNHSLMAAAVRADVMLSFVSREAMSLPLTRALPLLLTSSEHCLFSRPGL